MKYIISWVVLILVLRTVPVDAQNNWVPYLQTIQVKEYAGLQFRLTALVRAEVADDSASARLWARVDTETGVGFFENMWDSPIRSQEWQVYAIKGQISQTAKKLAFGAICHYNGKFYFDDLKIEVETEEGQWESIYLTDFEDHHADVEAEVKRWREHDVNDFDAEIIEDDQSDNNHYLLIVGEGVPNFGINDEAGSFADVNGIQLYYEVYGEGQPLVILHGNGGSIENAAPHYAHFIDKNYKVIAVDSRAQGRSKDFETELTYSLLASDIAQLLDQLHLDSVYLWGHSDGAIIGFVMALKYPEKIKKLVAFAPNIIADSTGIEPPIYRWIEKTALTSEDKKERQLTTMMWKYPNIPFAELKNIHAEVLLMTGDRDFVPLSHTLQIFKNLPKSNLCVIPGSTHGASWVKKELFLQIVDDFFEKPFRMPSTIQWYKE